MKWFLLIGFWILLPYFALSQGAIGKKNHLSEKVFFGGGLGLQFGSVTAIGVSPMVGYKPKPNWFLGLKGNYQYFNDNSVHASTQIYGGSFFTSYIMFENIALYGEYEALNLESKYFDPGNIYSKNKTFWVHSPLLGGGFAQPMGDRSKVLILVLWNLSNSAYSFYSNPIIRLTFFF